MCGTAKLGPDGTKALGAAPINENCDPLCTESTIPSEVSAEAASAGAVALGHRGSQAEVGFRLRKPSSARGEDAPAKEERTKRARLPSAFLKSELAALELTEGNKWMRHFGMKPSQSIGFIQERLGAIQEYFGVPQTGRPEGSVASQVPSSSGKKKRKRDAPAAKRRSKRRRASQIEPDVVKAIRANAGLHERLLVMEPVEIREIYNAVKDAIPDLDMAALRVVLDHQGIHYIRPYG